MDHAVVSCLFKLKQLHQINYVSPHPWVLTVADISDKEGKVLNKDQLKEDSLSCWESTYVHVEQEKPSTKLWWLWATVLTLLVDDKDNLYQLLCKWLVSVTAMRMKSVGKT